MIKEKVINNPNLLGMGVTQYLRVSRRCPTLDQNSIFLLEVDPIPFLGLDLIDPRSSSSIVYTHTDRKTKPIIFQGVFRCTCISSYLLKQLINIVFTLS